MTILLWLSISLKADLLAQQKLYCIQALTDYFAATENVIYNFFCVDVKQFCAKKKTQTNSYLLSPQASSFLVNRWGL